VTLVEVLIASAIVGMTAVAALRATSGTALARVRAADRATATTLADGLMNEILAKPYADPDGAGLLGYEAGESSADKSTFDDVDDYNGWNESPPRDPTGSTIAGLSGWSRSVQVVRVSPTSLGQTSLTETGAKRVTVTVRRGATTVATRVAVKTEAP
jgi:MSHA pilin protein MshD